jgi:hypothetical protein
MSTSAIAIIIVAVVVIAVAVGAVVGASRTRQRRRLQDSFGPEYDRTVSEANSPKEAELDLRGRVQRRQQLTIRALSPAQRDRYEQDWRRVQAAFVDQPATALAQADMLITSVMVERGYPMEDFTGQAELVSVDHPTVVDNFRQAHGVYVASRSGEVPTEEMRRAVVAYRSLFSELVQDGQIVPDGQGAPGSTRAGGTQASAR